MEAAPCEARTSPCPPPASPVMGLLHEHLPLTLLLDLALGVRSDEVYEAEPADLSWLPGVAAPRAG